MRINMTAAILKFVYTIIIYLFLLRVVAKDLHRRQLNILPILCMCCY
ncbi:Nodule Cysteine-Rich (NCR) secreted peptide [Medicago truncatula]|uniref:Nodule Cysteine-Rich (NCR) secreted peptide n=1 Tax=Medicago truncatula TaxID=3880 RepID=A0A072U6R7_MEDTR|nr:Nodule Cysteine-Rich (NCR) secreted peptide [Medicago truncatula]